MAKTADISDELTTIQVEPKGEDVRDAITSALNKLNNNPGTAKTINGLSVDDLVLKKDVDYIFPLETELKQYGTRAVTSGGIYDYLLKVGNVIDIINNGTGATPDPSESIKNKIAYTNETKRLIKNAIIAKNVKVDDNTTFRAYADKINDIPTVAEITLNEAEITKNGEYDAGEDNAFGKVVVNVTANTTKKNISKAGTYKAEDDNYEGYSEVEVKITQGLMSKTITGEDLSSDSLKTTIKASDEGKDDPKSEKDIIGYSDISIDVSGKFAEYQQEMDPSIDGDSVTINAIDEDLYGYSTIKVFIRSTEGPFTVEFWDGENKLYTDNEVPKNGTAVYKGSVKLETYKDGYDFKGWDPKPIHVIKNLKCMAKWEKKKRKKKKLESKTWNEISENGGMDVEIGDTKKIKWRPCKFKNTHIAGSNAIATCVAKGEGNTTSTWIMSIPFDRLMYVDEGETLMGFSYYDYNGSLDDSPSSTNCLGQRFEYQNSDVCNFFSTTFVNAILGYSDQSELMFRNIEKWTCVCDRNGQSVEDIQNLSGVWMLSAQEYGIGGYETRGVSYPISHDTYVPTRSIRSIERYACGANVAEFGNTLLAGETYIVAAQSFGANWYIMPAGMWWNEATIKWYHSTHSSFPLTNPLNYICSGFPYKGYVGTLDLGFCL